MDASQTLQRLADRADVIDVVTRFAVSIDKRDWAAWRSCLADTVEVDYPSTVGAVTLQADDMAAVAAQFFARLDATQHISANHQVTIDGDHAVCVSTLFAQHFLAAAPDGEVQRQIGYYTNRLERLDGWRIVRSEQRVTWTEGNPAVFAHAAGSGS